MKVALAGGWWGTLVSAVVLGFAVGCSGPMGPEGPAGDRGAKGDPGDAGQKGIDGKDAPIPDAGTVAVKPPRELDSRVCGWTDTARQRINEMLAARGISSPSFDSTRRPVAAFDWDNTVLKNDIGDATFFWMVANGKILQPAGKDWGATNAALVPEAKAALNAACDSLAAEGAPLPTSTNAACADELISIYVSELVKGTTTKAWSPAKTVRINNPYAWVAQLATGYTPEQVRAFALAAYEENLAQPVGATQTIGTTTGLTHWVRLPDTMRDLIGALKENGFDVWVLTASPQNFVEPLAADLGISRDHVIGIRNVLLDGKLTYNLQGCGTVPDNANTLITFDEGKRCWMNKEIFHLPPAQQEARATELDKRPVFAAGDSDTDIAFVKDATYLKLAINRNKTQLMCNAYSAIATQGAASKWVVQPMFISPKGQLIAGYGCDTAKDNGGVNLIVDENGAFMPRRDDTVFTLPTCQ
ncbi:MAG: HAD family hydrolase [Myxococcaceae bacterium]